MDMPWIFGPGTTTSLSLIFTYLVGLIIDIPKNLFPGFPIKNTNMLVLRNIKLNISDEKNTVQEFTLKCPVYMYCAASLLMSDAKNYFPQLCRKYK